MTQRELIFKCLTEVEQPLFSVALNGVILAENLSAAHIRYIMLGVGSGTIDPTGVEIIANDNNPIDEFDDSVYSSSIKPDGRLHAGLAGMSYDTSLSIKLFLLNKTKGGKQNEKEN